LKCWGKGGAPLLNGNDAENWDKNIQGKGEAGSHREAMCKWYGRTWIETPNQKEKKSPGNGQRGEFGTCDQKGSTGGTPHHKPLRTKRQRAQI